MTRVDPVAVLTGGRNINIVGLNLTKMATETTNELAGFSGMAGTDLAGKSFAQTYDPAVNALVEALGNLGAGAAKVGLILGTSAHNYNDANAAAAHRPPPDIGPMPDQPLGCPPTPNVPSAWGDPSPGPWWWDLIVSYAQSKLWPDGHQDQLRASEGKLNAIANWAYRQAELLWDGMGHLRGQDAEDIEAGYAVASDIYQQLFTISENAKALAQMCADQARLIDETRSAIENAVAELGITTALIWAAGALLTPVTAGGSGYAATDQVYGGIIGSSQRLQLELLACAAPLGIEIGSDQRISESSLQRIWTVVRAEGPFWRELYLWVGLYDAARLSIRHGLLIMFG